MEYRYRINPNLKDINVFLQDIPIRMYPGNDYNLDARCDGDAQAKSGELRNAMYLNWIHRVEYKQPKVRKVKISKQVKAAPTDIPKDSVVVKVETIFDTAIDLEVFKTTQTGKLSIPSKTGKGTLYFKDRDHAIKRLIVDPELLIHLQTLCQG